MKGHPGADGAVERMYRAQCAKDDAMAEGIAQYLATNPHRQPLVIHCNGNFHSDYGLGTAARLAQRAPLAQAAIISMIAVPDVAKAEVPFVCRTDARNKRGGSKWCAHRPAMTKASANAKQGTKPGTQRFLPITPHCGDAAVLAGHKKKGATARL
jgi:hypothetical protein